MAQTVLPSSSTASHNADKIPEALVIDTELTGSTRALGEGVEHFAITLARVSTLGDLSQTVEAILSTARQTLHCDITTLYAFDAEANRFVMAHGSGCKSVNLRPPEKVRPDSPLWRIIQLKSPPFHLIASVVREDEPLYGNFTRKENIASSYALQLRFNDQPCGVLFVNFKTPHQITQEEVNQAQLYANVAASAIQTSLLRQKVAQKTQTLDAVRNASEAIASNLNLNEILKVICAQALHVVGFDYEHDHCFSYIGLREDNTLRFIAANTPNVQDRLNQFLPEIDLLRPKQPGIVSRVVRSKKAEIVDFVRGDPDYVPFDPQTGSQMSVPILHNQYVIGVITLEHPVESKFSNEHLQGIVLLAAHAATAIRNAQYVQLLTNLTEVADGIDSGRTRYQDVLTSILNGALRTLNADGGYLYPYDIRHEDFIWNDMVVTGFSENFRVSHPKRGTLSRKTLEQRYYCVPDVTTEKNLSEVGRQLFIKEGINTLQVVTLTIDGEYVGVLGVAYRNRHEISPDDQTSLKLFAHDAASALRRVRLADQVKRRRIEARTITNANAASDVTKALDEIAKGARECLEADSVTLYIYSPTDRTFRGAASDGTIRVPIAFPDETLDPQHEIWRVTNLGAPYFVTTDNENASYLVDNDFARAEDIRSVFAIQLRSIEGVIGVMFANYKLSRRFLTEEQDLIVEFANLAAVTISNRLFIQRLARTRDAARIASDVSALHELDMSLDSLVAGVRQALDCDIVSVYVFDAERKQFTHSKSRGRLKNTPRKASHASRERRSNLWRAMNATSPCLITGIGQNDGELLDDEFAQIEDVKASLAIRLMAGHENEQCIGVMFVDYRQTHYFDAHEIVDALQLARQASVIVSNAQLYAKTLHQSEVENIFHLAASTASQLDTLEDWSPDTRLRKKLESLIWYGLRLVGAAGNNKCFGYIALRSANKVRILSASSPQLQDLIQRKVDGVDLTGPQKSGIFGRALDTKESQYVPSVQRDLDYIEVVSGVKSQVCVPLKINQQVIGGFCIEHPQSDPFTRQDVNNLETLSENMAWLIQRHYEDQFVDSLVRASQANYKGGLDASLQQIAESIRQAFRCDLVSLYTYTDIRVKGVEGKQIGRQEISYPAILAGELLHPEQIGDSDKLNSRQRLDLNALSAESVLNKLLHEFSNTGKKTYYAANSQNDPILNGKGFVNREAIASSVGVVLTSRDKIVGFVFLNYRAPHHFDSREKKILEVFASYAAGTIEAARTNEEFRQTLGITGARTTLMFMGMTSSIWFHSVRGHCVTIKDIAGLLEADLASHPAALKLARERLSDIRANADRITQKQVQLPLASEEVVESVPIAAVVQERLSQLWQKEKFFDKQFNFISKLSDSAIVRISVDWFKQAFDILIDNAINAMIRSGGKLLNVTVEPSDHGSWVDIVIQDSGEEVDEWLWQMMLVEPISKESHESGINSGGLGIGLMMARVIIECYEGEIIKHSTSPSGTTLKIRLPSKDPNAHTHILSSHR
jgi:GAF domain-containing protein